MCGICGFKGKNQEILRSMVSSLFHRGPNDQSFYADESFSLGMARLAILDLVSGNQPIWNENKSILVISNGEIYNYKELRDLLEKKGHYFYTSSDTEVLVHLYEEYKEETPKHLLGMFAFCIYDLNEKKLFLSRDRFGEKPLYYYFKEDKFVFSSELQSLLKYPGIKRILHLEKLSGFLEFGFTIDHTTLFKNIYSLPPGHSLCFQNNEITIFPYFKIEYSSTGLLLSEEETILHCKTLLRKAVERQMVSDVPIGAFLSGGIDSSSVVAIMQQVSKSSIKTFNVKFEESTYDESTIAKAVSNHLGTDHHEIFIPNQTFDETIFWEIINHIGYPFSDSSAIPSYLVTREIRKHVTVALSGDGGDELFGGYSDFLWGLKIKKLKTIPSLIRKPILKLLHIIPEISGVNIIRQIQKALNIVDCDDLSFFENLYAIFPKTESNQFIKNRFQSNSNIQFPDAFASYSFLRKMMWFRIHFLLPEDMLIKIDRMSMAHSLEVRAPFLDPELFDFSATLNDKFLIRGQNTKWIIRQIMKTELPEIVFNHPKTGFSIPLHRYFNKDFQNLSYQIVHKNHPLNEILDYNLVKIYLDHGFNLMKNTSKRSVYKSAHKLWILVQLYAWFDLFQLEIE